MSLNEYIKKRGIVKASLTRLVNFVSSESFKNEGIAQLRIRLEKANTLWDNFDEIQTLIEITDESPIHLTERDEFESIYYKHVGILREQIDNKASVFGSCIQSVGQPESTQQGLNGDNLSIQGQIKLPRIDIPTFSGGYLNWLSFFETFQSLVDNNNSLSKVQKFYYLKSCLKNEASQTLNTITVTEDNYELALQLLKERYQNRRLIIQNHLNELMSNLPAIQKESSQALRNLLDIVTTNLKALEQLEIPVQQWDIIINYLITSKFDSFTLREWEKQLKANEIPSFDDMKTFINQRCQILDAIQMVSHSNKVNKSQIPNNSHTKNRSNNVATNSHSNCPKCKESHALYQCSEFLKLNNEGRVNAVKELKVCINCLKAGHFANNCQAGKCKICHKRHNTLLHLEISGPSEKNPLSSNEPSVSAHCRQIRNRSEILLSTAIVYIVDKHGHISECRALLDVGSQCNFITANLVNKLSIPTKQNKASITGVSSCINNVQLNANISLQSKYKKDFQISINCLILEKITEDLPINSFDKNSVKLPSNLQLADPRYNESRPVDLLLNADVFWKVLCPRSIEANRNHPHLQETKLGWVLGGPFTVALQPINQCNVSVTNNQLHDQLAKFWDIEQSGINQKANLTVSEIQCEETFAKTHTRDETGRFVVKLPFKENVPKLGQSHDAAVNRFLNLEKRLNRTPDLKRQYVDFMKEYEMLGHMQEVSDPPDDEEHFYLPHHPVIKESSTTSKLRVVFDGSAKTTNGLSLNDKLINGPTIQPDIFTILTNFRTYEIAVTADICKMYRQVLIHPEDRKFQLIVWRDDPSKELKTYCLNTVTYGTTSAPYLAIKSLQQLSSNHPKVKDIIINNFYVDDLLTGATTRQGALDIKTELTTVLRKGGFELRKWASNDPPLLIDGNTNEHSINIDKQGDTKTLGLTWNCSHDTLTFKFNTLHDSKGLSKRSILSTIAQLFDPLGLIGPVIIIPKLMLQELWSLSIGWDDKIPLKLERKWREFVSLLPHLSLLHIPRKTVIANCDQYELHGFCDASERAYGACIYIRSIKDDNNITVRLVTAKSRVAPLKTITLPRLELCGATLLSQLIDKVKNNSKISFSKTYCWTDSTIVLAWINATPTTWKTFIANRISEIQSITNPREWYHVSGKDNPADIISRGLLPDQLIESKQWWQGPDWLSNSSHIIAPSVIELTDLEKRNVVNVATTTIQNEMFELLTKFSSFEKLQKIIAYILRFIKNCKCTNGKLSGRLQLTELKRATNVILKLCQAEPFAIELHNLKTKNRLHKKSVLMNLNPFVDNNGLIRVGGRLGHVIMHYDHKHPIVLPKTHSITKLLILREHKLMLHAGHQTTLASLRRKFWPLCGRSITKRLIRNCVTCFRVHPRSMTQQMGDLPTFRAEPARPFIHCGVDYAGPIMIKESRNRNKRLIKIYLAIFVCLAVKAVHIEIISDCTSESFIAALRRFMARRGKVSHIFSDNGTQFVGANRELKSLLNSGDLEGKLTNELSRDQITWHFIPPRAPHWGGIWEAAVKSVKSHLKKIAGNSILTHEEMLTLLHQIEASLNSRPLTPLSDDPTDFSVLTPGHFLIGEPMNAVVDPDVTDIKLNRLSRWQLVQRLYQQFWKHWRRDYLNQLQQRPKWHNVNNQSLREGQLVILKEDNTPPLCWRMGRILETYPGQDGLIRVAKIKTQQSECIRDIRRICVLPIDSDK